MNLFKEARAKVTDEVMDEYNDLPSRTLARILHNLYPGYFPSIESARDVVRYRRGASGDKDREHLTNRKYVKQSI
jgi:hypothetical protein